MNFCYFGGTKCVEGVGDQLSALPKRDSFVLLVFPNIHMSSAEAYRLWDTQSDNYESGPVDSFSLYNAFEKVILPMYPEIAILKDRVSSAGASNVMMTGSGSTVFGIFQDKLLCEEAKKTLSNNYKNIYVCRYVSKGFSIKKNYKKSREVL